MGNKLKCVRCESLEIKQRSKAVTMITNTLGDKIPLCSVCIVEITDEEEFFRNNSFDDSEYRDEIFT